MLVIKTIINLFWELIILIPLLFIAFLARYTKKSVDIGIGPQPIISHIHHKNTLIRYGFTAETFVQNVYFITDDFDVRADLIFPSEYIRYFLAPVYLFILSIFRYRCIYIYFNGGPFFYSTFLWKLEPFLYQIANVKTVVMAYGSDVQDLSRSPNLLLKDTYSKSYPTHRLVRKRIEKAIDLWTKRASHVISGVEWVDYMYHWDTLMLGHFSIDTDKWHPIEQPTTNNNTLKILHAPNHRHLKGTQYFIEAIDELKNEGFDIELVLLEKVSNEKIKEMMASVDIVADQLIVGWYAMFAIEAMAMGKPVLCYLRPDLIELYTTVGLVEVDEIPIINCTPLTVKAILKNLVIQKESLVEIGNRSREFVLKHHSLKAIGQVFSEINQKLKLFPNKL
jgi:glycosyltransferase involved in cell wall biosynthesis